MKATITFLTVFFCIMISQAQNNDYSKLWKKVEAFEVEGLPKSALKTVTEIEVLAKKDSNQKQLIKTLLFKSKFALTLEENAQIKVITDFKLAISKSRSPEKNVLQNMLATLYWQYFRQNRWKFYNRTKTSEKVDETDFRTWDLETLFEDIHCQFQESLENKLVLQQTPIRDFEILLTTQENSKTYRPTVFDLLNHNALEFYKTSENRITKPAETFILQNDSYLSEASEFAKLKLESTDDLALQYHALSIYQDLIHFHLKNPKSLALAKVNIDRLHFVNQNSVIENKHDLLLNTYKSEAKSTKENKVEVLYNYEIAYIYYNQGLQYNPNTPKKQWKLKEALELCKKTISIYPKSSGAEKCETIKTQILKSQLQITTESNLRPNQNEKILVRYKNLNSVEFTSYKLSKKQFDNINKTYNETAKLSLIKKLKADKTWTANLKNENDYQNHSTELLLPQQNSGLYLITVKSENIWATTTLQVTDIAMVESEDVDQKQLQFIDRNNGKPIANAEVKLSFKYRDYKVKIQKLTTNDKGFIRFKKASQNRSSFEAEISCNNQAAYFAKSYINHYNRHNNKDNTVYQSFIFTDRSIYRPSQTVYFKAIALKTEDLKSEVVPNELFEVTLYNTNNEKINTLELQTNDFGSVSGEFILPNNGLNGQYYIEIDSKSGLNLKTNHYFSVEEYKRPKFETTFNPVTETFKVNDSVTVKGLAKAFAGSNITDAKVSYKVKREVNYPRWYMWGRPFQNTQAQEITFGETTTNEKGEFDITFKAIPDEKANKKNLPIFTYKVTADVTDINGETRSATTTVKVGYHTLLADISIADLIDKTNKKQTLSIETKNLNGEFVPAKGQLNIYKLNAPKTVLRPRPWQAPDYKNWSEADFKTLFPHEAYKNENDIQNWAKGDLVLTEDFNTQKEKSVALGNLKKWKSGKYVAILTSKDNFGQAIKDEANFTVYSNKDEILADNQLFQIKTDKTSYDVNDTAEISLATASNNLVVSLTIEKNHNIVNSKIITLNKNTKNITLPISKEDLGGFVVHYSYAFANSFMSGQVQINVPYPISKLDIETLTFRDKLQPGTDETWSFKIKGDNKEKVSAELLASMYDASLDQFKPHNWQFNPFQPQTYRSYYRYNANHSFGTESFRVYQKYKHSYDYSSQYFDTFNWFGLSLNVNINRYQNYMRDSYDDSENETYLRTNFDRKENKNFRDGDTQSSRYYRGDTYTKNALNEDGTVKIITTDEIVYDTLPNGKIVARNLPGKISFDLEKPDFTQVSIRKNLQETAFFFPKLTTNEAGEISFNFTTPEALTKWNINLLAHNKKGEFDKKTLTAVTQKELMILPNAPRFLREGDIITISSKIANLTDKTLNGQARLELTDALSGKSINIINGELGRNYTLPSDLTDRSFEVSANGNTNVSWELTIPKTVQAVQYKIIAKTNQFSDGEQNVLPVLSNRMLVTESLPMHIKTGETKTFTLDKLKNNTSKTLQHHKLSLEITSNPAWYAVQALPYLMEYPYECNEQTFSRYYANALASHIANSNPRIQDVFKQWKNSDALLSNLEKNQELKSILIEETPWLRDAQSETEQKKRIALLFDLNKMKQELEASINKLKTNQMTSGAWSWFGDYRANRYITQHIITGFGHLNKLGVSQNSVENAKKNIIQKAIPYLDTQFVKEYEDLKRYNPKVDLSKDHLSMTQLHYLYMRSFFPEIKSSNKVEKIKDYYLGQIKKYWLKRPLYAKGLMALISFRNEDKKTSTKILNSLKETSITNEELGMYWKENTNSYYWYKAPIETQALLIEAFSEIENDTKIIDNLKVWLLKNKQTNQWSTTKSTTDAIYAILLQGSDWLSVSESVNVLVGKQAISERKLQNTKTEAGTGYYKVAWNGTEIKPELAEVTLTKKEKGITFGSLYWQYFEYLDAITAAKTPLQLKKQLFRKKNTKTGEVITEIKKDTKLKVGDLIRVRIELRSDRTMEFVHLKDMRAAGLEPINVLSQYKYQDGLGYYESTKDASTNFFFDVLPKGIYVFEYDLRVNNAGEMSNGITTIQSMYAPEFSSHSKGDRLSVSD
ncbi:alpha-2-macroglobulin [Aurantibacter sp.]|uniref:alpha-2-macroglobulin family protein n=1 Tax=Aurantibacter sp. TaxID=2807103 RepID=UPI0035C87E48